MKRLIYDNYTLAMVTFILCGGFFGLAVQMMLSGSVIVGVGFLFVSLAHGFLGMGWHGREERKMRKLKKGELSD